jgi:hypothetical protein
MAITSSSGHRPRKRQRTQPTLTLYDAVAGRAGQEGFLQPPQASKHRDTLSTAQNAIPPDEVLFRRNGAPLRYAEDDIYWANERLKPEQRLPDPDLLMAVLRYASDYYSAKERKGEDMEESWRSLDETAMIAIGVLIEEAVEEVLAGKGRKEKG